MVLHNLLCALLAGKRGKKLFSKKSGNSGSDKEIEELRKKFAQLAAGKGTAEPKAQEHQHSEDKNKVADDNKSTTGSSNAAANSSAEVQLQQQQYATVDPERYAENERITNLIMQQIKELIEIDNNLKTKIKELEAKTAEITTSLNASKDVINRFNERLDLIEKNMEKFVGLYEVVTNRFNPFVEDDDKSINLSSSDKYTGSYKQETNSNKQQDNNNEQHDNSYTAYNGKNSAENSGTENYGQQLDSFTSPKAEPAVRQENADSGRNNVAANQANGAVRAQDENSIMHEYSFSSSGKQPIGLEEAVPSDIGSDSNNSDNSKNTNPLDNAFNSNYAHKSNNSNSRDNNLTANNPGTTNSASLNSQTISNGHIEMLTEKLSELVDANKRLPKEISETIAAELKKAIHPVLKPVINAISKTAGTVAVGAREDPSKEASSNGEANSSGVNNTNRDTTDYIVNNGSNNDFNHEINGGKANANNNFNSGNNHQETNSSNNITKEDNASKSTSSSLANKASGNNANEHILKDIHKEAHPDYHFRLPDGSAVKSIADLRDALASMDEATFMSHVNENKNDFADWVELVFNNKALASKIRELKTRDGLYSFLSSYGPHS